MYLPDTITADSVHAPLLETISVLSPRLNARGLPAQSLRNFTGHTLPRSLSSKFERKLRNILNEHFQSLLVQLPLELQARFPQLYQHAQNTLSLTLRLVRLLDLSDEEQITIALGAFFHDIGKLEIDEELLNKPAQLTLQEFEIVKCHPAYGASILTRFASFPDVAALVYHHHERWDGNGYPDRLAGEAIPLGARVIAIADAFDAMISERSYQTRRTPREALEELQRCAGTQFDPLLVQIMSSSRAHPVRQASIAQPYRAGR